MNKVLMEKKLFPIQLFQSKQILIFLQQIEQIPYISTNFTVQLAKLGIEIFLHYKNKKFSLFPCGIPCGKPYKILTLEVSNWPILQLVHIAHAIQRHCNDFIDRFHSIYYMVIVSGE